MITDGWNSQRRARITQQDPGHVKDAMKENKMITGGWNRKREASNNQEDPGSFEGTLEEEIIPGGWNGQKEGPGSFEGTLEEEIIPGGWNSQKSTSDKNMIMGQLKASWRGQG